MHLEKHIEFIISNGFDINAKDNCGMTALHYASMSKSKEIANILISYGAENNIKDNNGETPQSIAEYFLKDEE